MKAPPTAVPPGFSATASKDDTAYVWTLAFLPLVSVVLDLAIPRHANTGLVFPGFLAVTVLLCFLDSNRLKAKGIGDVDRGWAILVPIYLILRTRRVGSTAAIPIVWFVTFGASILTSAVAPLPFDVDTAKIDSQLASQIRDQYGQSVTVVCPAATNVFGGDTITCAVHESGGVTEHIIVQFNNDSTYTWGLQ